MATFTTTEKRDGLDYSSQKTYSTTTHGSKTEINSLIIDPHKTNPLGNAAILARSGVPDSHRRAADNYMIIKKIFGHPVVQSKISEEEKLFLGKYDYNPLEFTTAKQMNEELSFLKKWSNSRNIDLQEASDRIIQIRAKELKHLIATNYVDVSSEVYNGYRTLEKYFEDISKYCNER